MLAVSGTTCTGGDRSAYFWPVVRIDKSVRAGVDPAGGAAPAVSCPDVAGRLPVVPASAAAAVERLLARLDRLTATAQAKLGGGGRIDPRRNNAVLAALRTQRVEVIRQIGRTMTRAGLRPAGFVATPQLRITLSYGIPLDVQRRGQYALDSFPEENHNPFSDHNDFINVNSTAPMKKIAACVTSGRRCS